MCEICKESTARGAFLATPRKAEGFERVYVNFPKSDDGSKPRTDHVWVKDGIFYVQMLGVNYIPVSKGEKINLPAYPLHQKLARTGEISLTYEEIAEMVEKARE